MRNMPEQSPGEIPPNSDESKESREGELTVQLTREEAIKISDAVEEMLNNFHGLRSGSATPEQEKAYWQQRDEWLSLEKKFKDLIG